jgi:hypothetical protein
MEAERWEDSTLHRKGFKLFDYGRLLSCPTVIPEN